MSADETQRQPSIGFRPVVGLLVATLGLGGVFYWQYVLWNIRAEDDSAAERLVTDQQAFEREIRAGAQAVPALVEKLASPDLLIRKRSVFALERIGHDAVEAYPALVKLLDDDDPWFRSAVLEALGHIGHEREALAPRAAEMLTSDKTEVFEAATRFLISTGPAVIPHLRRLLEQDDRIALRALQLLHRLEAADEESLAQIRDLGHRSDEFLRGAAMIALLDSGKATDEEIRAALNLISREQEPVRENSHAPFRNFRLSDEVLAAGVTAVERRGTEGQLFLPELLTIVESKERYGIHPRVCAVIVRMEPDRAAVIPRLKAATNDQDFATLRTIGTLIHRLGGDNADLTELVLERERQDKENSPGAAALLCALAPERSAHWLADRPYSDWRGMLDFRPDERLVAFGAHGPEAKVLARRMVAGLHQLEGDVSLKSELRELEWLGPSAAAAAPFLCELFEELAQGNTGRAFPFDIARVFQSIGPAAADEIPRLLKCCQRVRNSRDLAPSIRDFLQVMLLESLQAIGADRSLVQAEATGLLDSGELVVRVRAAGLVLSLDHDSEESFVRLIEVLHDSIYPAPQILAIQILAREGRRSALAIEPLTLLLDHSHVSVRLEAVRALSAICRPAEFDAPDADARSADDFHQDPRCAVAVAALARALEDRSREIRRAAVEALARFGPAAASASPALKHAASDWRNGLRNWTDPYWNEDPSGSFLIEQYTGSKRTVYMLWHSAGADARSPTVSAAALAALIRIQPQQGSASTAELRPSAAADAELELSY